MKGKRHLRESRAVQLTNAPAGNAQRLGMGKVCNLSRYAGWS